MNFFDASVTAKTASEITVAGPGVAPFAAAAKNFSGPVGAKVKIGVRPEHLLTEAGDGFRIAGAVELVERLGETSYAHVRVAPDVALIAEIRGRGAPNAGDSLALSAHARDLHLFDEQGERIETE
jgi:ABC-type sugar transport system ATPase subunit